MSSHYLEVGNLFKAVGAVTFVLALLWHHQVRTDPSHPPMQTLALYVDVCMREGASEDGIL